MDSLLAAMGKVYEKAAKRAKRRVAKVILNKTEFGNEEIQAFKTMNKSSIKQQISLIQIRKVIPTF